MRTEDTALLRCPASGLPLFFAGRDAPVVLVDGELSTPDGRHTYPVRRGIPRLLPARLSGASTLQRAHYDSMTDAYLEVRRQLDFTKAYWEYLGGLLASACACPGGGTVLEVCCGDGSFVGRWFPGAAHRLGVDISEGMLEAADPGLPATLACGDATSLPVRDAVCDVVCLHGGIHHVPDRGALYREIARVLKPGGRMAALEPADDFPLWRWLRWMIYRISPNLEAGTEKPLRRKETFRQIAAAGLACPGWQPCSYLAGAFFANTDVLGFMRHFARLPGHAPIARALTRADDLWRRVPLARGAGLLAIVTAVKPAA